jgi:hypothetical protein
MREARRCRCARQGIADARGKAGQMREREARQGRADAGGKAGHMQEARPGRMNPNKVYVMRGQKAP